MHQQTMTWKKILEAFKANREDQGIFILDETDESRLLEEVKEWFMQQVANNWIARQKDDEDWLRNRRAVAGIWKAVKGTKYATQWGDRDRFMGNFAHPSSDIPCTQFVKQVFEHFEVNNGLDEFIETLVGNFDLEAAYPWNAPQT